MSPKECACCPATGDVCGAHLDARRPKWEPADDDNQGDPNIDGTDYEPAGSWAE